MLEFLNNIGGKAPNRNRVVVPVRQDTLSGGIGSLELILELLKSLKLRALVADRSKVVKLKKPRMF